MDRNDWDTKGIDRSRIRTLELKDSTTLELSLDIGSKLEAINWT